MALALERTCTQCGEDANLYCRLCKLNYCWEHPCHHLSAAHEDDSYTQRLGDEIHASLAIRDIENNQTPEPTIRPDTRTIQSYSLQELQTLYDKHRAEARRIRAELERRTLFASGVVPNAYAFDSYNRKKLQAKSPKPRRLPRSDAAAVSLLSDKLRNGEVTVEYILDKLKRFSK
jgi:hypothetical protein